MKIKPPLIAPIPYSEKSIRDNKFYPDEFYTCVSTDTVVGVFTPLTQCYSQSCLPGQSGCYSYSCPNKPTNQAKLVTSSEDSHDAVSQHR